MNDLTKYTDPEAQRLIFRADDLCSRTRLLAMSEHEYDTGNRRGAACLFHAEMYLADREAYERNPPPSRLAIPLLVDTGERMMETRIARKLSKPQRIQRKRTRGWKMPEGVVYVGRPTVYGNPFRVGDYVMRGDALGERGLMSFIYTSTTAQYADERYTLLETPEQCVEWFRWYVGKTKNKFAELRGKDLACWCRLDRACHADVLLEIANS